MKTRKRNKKKMDRERHRVNESKQFIFTLNESFARLAGGFWVAREDSSGKVLPSGCGDVTTELIWQHNMS